MDRDACVDPQPGDKVKLVNGQFRRCTRRSGGDVWYITSDTAVEKNCWITTWTEWCRKRKAKVAD